LNKIFNFGVIKEIEENQPSLNFKNKEKNGANPKTLPLCLLQEYLLPVSKEMNMN
jgi:hypothetical protein